MDYVMDYTYANVVLELFCALVTLVPTAHLLFSDAPKTRQRKLLAAIMSLHVVMLLCDAAAWAFDNVTSPNLRIPMIAANFIVFVIGSVNFVFLTDYIVTSISRKGEVSRFILRIVAVFCLSSVAMAFLSLFNGCLFYIDESNQFIVGPLYTTAVVLIVCMMFFVSFVIVYYKRWLGTRDTLTFLSYIIFLLIAGILHIFFPGLMFAYAAYTLSFLIIYVNMHLQQEKRLRDSELELANARISVMISQIQPHFLYNTLSVVVDLCRRDPEAARESVIEFSRYLRGNLSALTRKEPIPFEEELKHVGNYLSLESKRFGKRMNVEYRIGAKNFFLPPLTLQPIVENAVQHGITARERGGTIVVEASESDDEWLIRVSDDGVGFDAGALRSGGGVHLGLDNVRFRLESMCRGRLEVRSVPGEGTTVTIALPRGPR